MENNNKKKTIFDATIKLMEEKNFDDISVMDICKETGISRGTFYLYCNNKDDIFRNSLSYTDEVVLREITNILTAPENNITKFYHLMEFYIHACDSFSKEALRQIYRANIACGQESIFSYNEDLSKIYLSLLDNAINLGEIKCNISATKLFEVIVDAGTGSLIHWITSNQEKKCSEYISKVIRNILNMLQANL